uniref:Methyltransferase FkbM domain-containing protein n=1 Tax=Strigamia maritima TaxID=126957 RepID=T1ITI3_STRMM
MRKKNIIIIILFVAAVGACVCFMLLGSSVLFLYSSKPTSISMVIEGLNADDEALLMYVRDNFVVPPSTKPYSLSSSKLTDPSMGQAAAAYEILNRKRNGFFVECGALDGITRSNTYWMERHFGWKGVLIEADPENFQLLLKKNRRAYAVPVCLSSHAHKVPFNPHFNLGKIATNKKADNAIFVQCLTLWTVMLAVNQTKTIDYFSLDVEGNEMEVLRAIPFDLLDIRVMSVEWTHVPEGKNYLRHYVESKGYVMIREVTAKNRLANDFIFAKREIL